METSPFEFIDTDLLERNSIPTLVGDYFQFQKEMQEIEVSDPTSEKRLFLYGEMCRLDAEIARLRQKHGVPEEGPASLKSDILLFG